MLGVLPAPGASAADAPDTVLVRRGDIVITQGDFEVELLRIPAENRTAFAASSRRNRELISRMLQNRELAVLAREKKLDQDPATRRRLQLEEERFLATVLMAQVDEAAGREFDVKRAAFERRARERYTVDSASFARPATVTFTQIFFAPGKDGSDAAQKRAGDALAKIKAGADVAELAVSISDDPGARETRGRLGPSARADLDPSLADAVFALTKPGDVGGPVKTRAGWHVVRLDERTAPVARSFDEVKDGIMADLREKHVTEAHDTFLKGLGGAKETYVNEPAIEALKAKAPPAETGGPPPVK
jgi:peptidyl-prolyl cis-trans isomerase C